MLMLLIELQRASNGRQVMRSPAVPPARRALSAALYSAGAEGENSTLMSGIMLVEGGNDLLFQMSASSLRQLSIFKDPASAAAMPAMRLASATPAPTNALMLVFICCSSLLGPIAC